MHWILAEIQLRFIRLNLPYDLAQTLAPSPSTNVLLFSNHSGTPCISKIVSYKNKYYIHYFGHGKSDNSSTRWFGILIFYQTKILYLGLFSKWWLNNLAWLSINLYLVGGIFGIIFHGQNMQHHVRPSKSTGFHVAKVSLSFI